MMVRTFVLVTLIALQACARQPTIRFINAPPVTAVNDRQHTPTQPRPREYVRTQYHLNGNVVRRLTRALEVRRTVRALGVNALDEVPDSTWFTNRIGVRDLSVEEIRRGTAELGSPEAHLPWTVRSTKVGGMTLGFVITDARGERFILKFDQRGLPEMETGADAVASRLLWAIGYNVPEDHVVYFQPNDLRLAPDAKVKDVFGNTRPLRPAELARMLEGVERERDGRLRGLASRILVGTSLGGHASEGVRADDPNDRIPHELRRDLRGAYAIFAWLDHVDIKEDNFLDMWISDREQPAIKYVKHYLLDFGSALGAMTVKNNDLRRGHTYFFDPADMFGSLVTLGLRPRSWVDRSATAVRGVGLLDVDHYDPGRWKPYSASYAPFHTADRFDGLWGAKLIMRFTREQLRAAVETARFSDPRAMDVLTDMLVRRQRATARYWFMQTAPLDRFALRQAGADVRLCFDDLLLAYDLAHDPTSYEIAVRDRDGRALGRGGVVRPDANGHACTAALPLATAGDGYTVIEVRTRRTSFDGRTFIHVARSQGEARIIGIWRQ